MDPGYRRERRSLASRREKQLGTRLPVWTPGCPPPGVSNLDRPSLGRDPDGGGRLAGHSGHVGGRHPLVNLARRSPRWLSFTRHRDRVGTSTRFRSRADPQPHPVVKTSEGATAAEQFSPDGRWMAYVSERVRPVRSVPSTPLPRARTVRSRSRRKVERTRNGTETAKRLFYRVGNKMMVGGRLNGVRSERSLQPRVLFERRIAFGNRLDRSPTTTSAQTGSGSSWSRTTRPRDA